MLFALTNSQYAQFKLWNRRHKCKYIQAEEKAESEMYGRLEWRFRQVDKKDWFVEIACLCGEKKALNGE